MSKNNRNNYRHDKSSEITRININVIVTSESVLKDKHWKKYEIEEADLLQIFKQNAFQNFLRKTKNVSSIKKNNRI